MIERVKIKASAKAIKRQKEKPQKGLSRMKAFASSVVEEVLQERGRPSKYDPKYPAIIKLLAQRGAIQAEIAEALQITTRTLQNWIASIPEVCEAIQAGNDVFNPRVERALAERATGFYADVSEWKTQDGIPVLKPVRKYFPPDVTACIFWLKNRLPNKWRDVQEHHHTGELQTSAELLAEIQADIAMLQREGHLKLIDVTPSSKANGKANGHTET